MTELKPCPFCNGNAKWDKDWQAVVCTNCGASTRHSILVTRKKKEAIEAWNRRAEIKGKEGKISPNWHTGTPTENGYYLLRLNYANLLFDVALLKDGKFKSTHDYEIAVSYILAWQRIEPYKEES